MNYIKHLSGFFERIIPDRNLNPTHISLYLALFQFWNINRFLNPISISRTEVMLISKISSKATYHKCMKDLNEKGYVKYEPSHNPYKGSMISLFDFSENLTPVQKKASITQKNLSTIEPVARQQQTGIETGIGTGTEQALVSSINNTNITNQSNFKNDLNLDEQAKIFQNENLFFQEEKIEEKKLREKKKKIETPTNEEVKCYFLQHNFPELEANKFFNYFSSVGWLVGGKIPMVDWQAAAQNWMLNANKFKSYEKPPDRAKQLRVGNEKDYGEAF